MNLRPRLGAGVLFSAVVGALVPALPLGAAPNITQLSLRGVQAGNATTLIVEGSGLLPSPEILLPIPIAAQTVKEGATDNRVEFEVVLGEQAPVGIFPLRIANPEGVSNAMGLAVDKLPQLAFATELPARPAALSGVIRGTEILRTSLDGRAGERLVIEVEARRLGSLLNPVVRLYDRRGVQLDWAQGSRRLDGDARLIAVLPSDGRYTVEIHDALYRAADPGFFRLKIGDFHFADLAMPLGVKRGAPAAVELAGSDLPAGTQVGVDSLTPAASVPVLVPASTLLSGPAPQVVLSDFNEILESSPGSPVDAPVAVNGRLAAPGEEDRLQINVSPGTLRVDVLAHRAGSPLDAMLTVSAGSGETLGTSDDRPDTVDPGLDVNVPEGVNTVVLTLKDVSGRGGADYLYRVSVRPAGQPTFNLTVPMDRVGIPAEGSALVRVKAQREAYAGPIRLSFAGLPPGVLAQNMEIPAGANEAFVTLTGFSAPRAVLSRLVGESVGTGDVIRRVALATETPVSRTQAWQRPEVALASTLAKPVSVVWIDSDPQAPLPIGYRRPARVRVTRRNTAGPVRITLVTTQEIPKKTIKENNQDKQVDDLDRAIRLESQPVLGPDQTEADLVLQVPADLPNMPYDLAVLAELLSEDQKTVVASAHTPALRLVPIAPLSLALSGEPKVEAKAGGGPTGKLAGTLTRTAGFNLPLTVTLAGLPAELPPPAVRISGEQNDFALDVAFPFGTAEGDLKDVKLVIRPEGLAQSIVELPVAVKVVAGEPPPPPGPLVRLFEDESYFAALLHEGGGKVQIEAADRYSGDGALKVTPDQRFRSKMPNWGYKIAESPTEGQFRYLRFAWRKSGGASIMLQLNANGAFGPVAGQTGPAFRYTAGPTKDPLGASSLAVDANLPGDWVVVTRDLFADFGEFFLDGMAFTPVDGNYALYDHIYLARTPNDFAGCPMPVPPEQPVAIFEDEQTFVDNLTQGGGTVALEPGDRYSGQSSVRVTPDQRFNPMLPGLGLRVRENPGIGEIRFIRFAWKKQGGTSVCLQLNHDGLWGPSEGNPGKFRYDAGSGGESYGAALRTGDTLPAEWQVITRDLFADFGEFTLTGIALSPQDGDFALFDHVYVARSTRDFELVKPE
jgi:hypothetical protein